jgi:hypothetical protein
MNQETFKRIKAGKSQCERILLALQASPNQFVAMPILARLGAGSQHGFCMVHSRVADLRKAGHQIVQLGERRGDKNLSCYKLLTPVLTTDGHRSTQMEAQTK